MSRRGLFLPPFDALADPVLLADLAVEAEEAGWDGVFLWDHLLHAEPVTEISDPWTAARRSPCAPRACSSGRWSRR